MPSFAPLMKQAAGATRTVARKPAAAGRKKAKFHHGCRKVEDHKHMPTGDWATRQPAWAKRCAAAEATLKKMAGDLTKGKLPTGGAVRGRPIVECACGHLSPADALEAARTGTMRPGALASKHIDHYLTGKGADFHEDLRKLLLEDVKVRKKLAAAIKIAPTGCVFISQDDYDIHDWKFALGGIDRMDYAVDAAAGTVHVSFKDRYQWHPEDKARPSNCIHVAAVELKASGAADFWMLGDAVVPLSWFTSGPTFFEGLFGGAF